MPVTADSYEAKVVEFAITMLAGSATFRALVGAATPALAKAFIIESWGGNPPNTGGRGKFTATENSQKTFAPPFALVHASEMDTELAGTTSYDYSGTVAIEIHMPRQTGSDTPPETFRRGRNTMGAIRDEIAAQFGATNCLATGSTSSAGPTLPDQTAADGNALIGDITINWQA